MGRQLLGAMMTAALLDLVITSMAAGLRLERGLVRPTAVGMAVLGVSGRSGDGHGDVRVRRSSDGRSASPGRAFARVTKVMASVR